MPNRTGDIIFSTISVTLSWLPFTIDSLAHAESRNVFLLRKIKCLFELAVIAERANVGNWIIQSEQDSQNQLFAPVIARIETHVTLLVVTFDVRYYLCSIWIEQTIDAYFMLDGPIDLTTNCRAAIVTRNRFLTRNIRHTKRFSDSRETRCSSRETRNVSRETRLVSRETRREVVTYFWAVLYFSNQ